MNAANSENQCWPEAANVSCDAMSELAIAETRRNAAFLGYQTLYPACQRFQELANRVEEHNLQKTPQLLRKACFTKTPEFQEGPWKQQFSELAWQQMRFDTWTRAKGATPK